MTHNGVIDTATGDLLRAGYCDFTNDGSFDVGAETVLLSVPFPPKVIGDPHETQMHRWDGAAWILVDQP